MFILLYLNHIRCTLMLHASFNLGMYFSCKLILQPHGWNGDSSPSALFWSHFRSFEINQLMMFFPPARPNQQVLFHLLCPGVKLEIQSLRLAVVIMSFVVARQDLKIKWNLKMVSLFLCCLRKKKDWNQPSRRNLHYHRSRRLIVASLE